MKVNHLTAILCTALLVLSAPAVWSESMPGTADSQNQAGQAPQGSKTSVSGVVTDVDGQPMVGVSVIIKGTKDGVYTDLDGKFKIDVSKGQSLQFSMIGYSTKEIVFNAQKSIKISLEEDSYTLSDVVVTGYTNIDRRMLTSTATTVRSEELERIGTLSVDQMLEGKVTGLQITTSSMTPGAAAKVRVRGSGSFVGSREPLWVIDGIPYENPVELDASEINSLDNINLIGNAITGLNPNDIESINVLKDASATAIYGSKAANGVIVVSTKRGKEGAKPVLSYQGTATVVTAPTYADFNTMNSLERVDVSREIANRGLSFWSNGSMQPVGYEGALQTYWQDGNFQAFQDKVSAMETLNYDWIGEYYKPAVQQTHSVSVSGGSKTAKYYASLAYDKQPGSEIGTDLSRITSRANVDLNVRPNILISFNMEGYVQDANYNLFSNGTTAFNEAYYSNRAVSPYDELGNIVFYEKKIGYKDLPSEIQFNQAMGMTYSSFNAGVQDYDVYGKYSALNDRNVNEYNIQNKGYAFQTIFQWDITKDLRWTTRLSYRNTNTNEIKTYGDTSWTMTVLRGDDIEDINDRSANYINVYNIVPSGGMYCGSYNESVSELIRNQINYTHSWGKHMINANFTQEASSVAYYGSNSWQAAGYNKDQGHYFNMLTAGGPTHNTTTTYWIYNQAGYKALTDKGTQKGYDVYPTITDRTTNTMSWVGILTYSFADKYILNFNARNDGSNAFGQYEKNKFRPSWSVSGRWNISDEDFMLDKSWVNELAVRSSFGYRGTRPNASPYMILNNYYQDSDYLPLYISSLYSLGNANLRWEKSATYDFGLSTSLFDNRLSAEFDFAYTNATDLLLTRPVSLVNGEATQLYNGGEKDDFCYEFSFRGVAVRTKDFTWAINGNVSFINEKVITGADDSVITIDKYLNGTMIASGYPVDAFYSYKFTGLNDAGLPTFDGLKDQNSEYAKLLNGLVFSGNRLPLVYGGLSTDFRYKRLSLNINATFKADYAVRLLQLYGDGTSMPRSYENLSAVFNSRWRNPGDELTTNVPRLNEATSPISAVGITSSSVTTNHTTLENMYDYSDVRTAKGDHIRFKSVTLSYRVPTFLGIKDMTVRAQAQNIGVFCFDKNLRGMDPDQVRNIGMPALPYYTLSVNFSL